MRRVTCQYDDPAACCPHEYLWPLLERLVRRYAPAPRKVFELGCGNGAMAAPLASHGYDVTGVDPSESGITIARQRGSERLHFDVGSTADDLAGRYGAFPLVISLEVIEHCPSPREYMQSVLSLLAPGGAGIISTPYHGWLKNVLITASGKFDSHFDPLWEGGHIKFYSIAKLKQLFAQHGLTRYEFHRAGRIAPLAKSVVAVIFKP